MRPFPFPVGAAIFVRRDFAGTGDPASEETIQVPMTRSDSLWIRRKTAEGTAWIVLSSGSRKAVGFLSSIVLARVLYPSDFGLIAMANVVIALLGVFDGFGVAAFLVYKGDEGRAHHNTAFWMSIALGTFLTAITWFAAPLAAAAYGNAEIGPILRALSFVFLFGSFSPVHRAQLRREMRFAELSRRNVGLALASSLITVALALSGFGVWSFVVPALIRPLAGTVIFWKLSPWRPRLRFHDPHLREIISYGRFVVGTDLVEMALRYADFLLIGHLLGAAALGVYSFAYFSAVALSGYVEELCRFVAFPVVASLRADREELENWGRQFLRALSLLVFPVLAGQLVVARDYILVLYGERWAEAIGPFRILLLLGLFTAFARPAVPMLRAAGRPELPFRITLVTLPLLVALLWFTVPGGVEAAALTVGLVLGASRVGMLLLAMKTLGLSLRRVLREGLPSATAAAVFCVILVAADRSIVRVAASPLLRLLFEVPVGAAIYFAVLALFFPATLRWGAERVASLLPGRSAAAGGSLR